MSGKMVWDSKLCEICGGVTAYGPHTIYKSDLGCKCKERNMKITVDVPLTQEQINDALDRLIVLVKDHAPSAPIFGALVNRYDNVVFLLNSMTGYQLAEEERVKWLQNKGG